MHSNLAIYIDVFLSNQDCINIFRKNLVQFKKLNIPIFIITNKEFPDDLQNEVNHILYQNVDLKFEKKYESYEELKHYSQNNLYKIEKIDLYYQKYGLSVLSNLYKGASTLKVLGYDSFIKLEWDFYIGDNDLSLLERFINEFKNENYKGKFLSNKNHLIDKSHHQFSAMIWAVNMDYFISKFPKILNENDYESYLLENFKNRDFKTVERVLYYSLVYNNIHHVKVDDLDKFNTEMKDTLGNLHISQVNISDLNSITTEKIFANFTNSSGTYIFFTRNINYINTDNPNFETVIYCIHTAKRSFTINHLVNTDCWSYTRYNIDDDEFPIKIKCGEKEISYKSKHEINIHFTLF